MAIEVEHLAKDLEIEFKNILTKQEYLSLLSAYQLTDSDLKTQTNYYFDTPDGLLRKAKMGLRIRELPDSREFTLKVPTPNKHSYLEITDCLNQFDYSKSLSNQLKLIESDVLTYLVEHHFPINQLELIGELTTIRGEKRLSPDSLLVLDKSMYYGCTDYELEMEVTDTQKGEYFFHHFLEKHQLAIKPAKKK